jgi:hypothetical protein
MDQLGARQAITYGTAAVTAMHAQWLYLAANGCKTYS